MSTARLTRQADQDLQETALFIARDNVERAESFIDEIVRHCNSIAQTPGIGRERPELGVGIRSLPHARYVIFYRIVGEDIEILRVLHGARDIEVLF